MTAELAREYLAANENYGCLMAMLPSLESTLPNWAADKIPTSELVEDGIETQPHVTVLYGFDPRFAADKIQALLTVRPELTLGKVSRFKQPTYDVLKVDVTAPELERLHGELAEEFHSEITPSEHEYHPHLTIAYVKNGACPQLDGATDFEGRKPHVSQFVYSLPKDQGRKVFDAGNETDAAYHELTEAVFALIANGGKGSGWFASAGHVPSIGLRETKERAFHGDPVATRRKLSKLESGALGERIVAEYLRKKFGGTVKSPNVNRNNYPLDLVHVRGSGEAVVVEVKTGLVSNGSTAQHWRSTIGEPSPTEKAWLAKAGPEAKARHNLLAMRKIIERKVQAAKDIARKLGKKVSMMTAGLHLHPDKGTADVHLFENFHSRIPWHSEQAKAGYVGSVKFKS